MRKLLRQPQTRAFFAGLVDPIFETPDDGTGMVPDMPVSKAALRGVVADLRSRSLAQTPDGRISKKILGVLTSGESKTGMVEGVNTSRLARLLTLLIRLRDHDQARLEKGPNANARRGRTAEPVA